MSPLIKTVHSPPSCYQWEDDRGRHRQIRPHEGGVRGLCIATRQYSSFCVCAGVLVLGGSDHMENEQNKGGEEIGQDVETLEREEEINGWRDNERSST